jgi:hypothetical protein
MKKLAALAALTMAGLALAAPATTANAAPEAAAAPDANAATAPDPQLAETDAALGDMAGLPLIAPYAADIQNQVRHTPVR